MMAECRITAGYGARTTDPPPVRQYGWNWYSYYSSILWRRRWMWTLRLQLPELGVSFTKHKDGYKCFQWHIYLLGFRAYGSWAGPRINKIP